VPGFWLGPKAATRGYRLHGFDTIGSTSTEAARAAATGDSGDVWFGALQQTEGRGRRGRAWETAHGNLAASLLVVPDCDPAISATLGFVAGVAMNRALDQLVPDAVVKQGIDGADAAAARIALKWPNDVLADGAKLSGILLEAQKRPDGGLAVVAALFSFPAVLLALGALDSVALAAAAALGVR
jgi:BirA family biotin operon repressor/biotin-[acetyl-CoA-carboxylase] ligase